MPTSTAVAVLPLTPDQLGKDAKPESEPVKVSSLSEAFKTFKPAANVEAEIDGYTYRLDADLPNMKGFTREMLEKRQETTGPDGKAVPKANSLADLKDTITVLTNLRNSWARPQVRKAWDDPAKREAILVAFQMLRDEMTAAKGEK